MPELQGVAHATPPAFSTFSRHRHALPDEPPALRVAANEFVDADGTTRRPLGNDAAVVLDLFDKPCPDRATTQATTAIQAWRCRRDGGTCSGIGYEVAGMQDLVDAIRSTGARTVILADGFAPATTSAGGRPAG
ncbi:hypothetical protein ACFW2D_34500 [Streptomyces sp. NPDC058914]|uniref:hypothetical protein n=1 Tax=Streptomyces TaxID=1883 RepID=UPI003694DCF7